MLRWVIYLGEVDAARCVDVMRACRDSKMYSIGSIHSASCARCIGSSLPEVGRSEGSWHPGWLFTSQAESMPLPSAVKCSTDMGPHSRCAGGNTEALTEVSNARHRCFVIATHPVDPLAVKSLKPHWIPRPGQGYPAPPAPPACGQTAREHHRIDAAMFQLVQFASIHPNADDYDVG